MTHTVSGLLREPPFIKEGCGQDGQSVMFGIKLSEMTKDYRTGEKSYANYKSILFAKSPAAIDFYHKALAEGAFAVVSCQKLKVEPREYNGQTYVDLRMENASLENGKYDDAPVSNHVHTAPVQQAATQSPSNIKPNDLALEDDIPF